MKALYVLFLVTFFGVKLSAQIITPCSRECICEEEFFPESRGVGAKVNCSDKRMKKFPSVLPQVTTTLHLQKNRISRLEGWHFKGMFYLRVLHLEVNRIKKLGATSLGYLPSLKALYLQNNRIDEITFGVFRNSSMLKVLNLSKNKLTKLDYAMFDSLDQLETLDLSANSISSLEDGAFLGLYRLKTLYLNGNQIKKIGAYLFADVYSLRSLFLFQNQISDIESGAFTRLLYLKILSLYDNKISSVPQKMVIGLENLEELYLHRNRITSIQPWTFSATKKLQKLYLYSNLLPYIPKNIFDYLRSLRILHLGINTLTYIADDAFRELESLHVLYLDSNRLSFLTARTFYGLSNLKDLHIFYNRISFIAKDTFKHLRGVSRLLFDIPEAYRVSAPPGVAVTRGNSLHCDCNVRWLNQWLKEMKITDMTCVTPPKLAGVSVTKLNESDFVCAPVEVSVHPKKILALYGDHVQVRCQTKTGATYHWMLNGTRLREDEYRVTSPLGLLTILGLTEEDLGEYVCIAQNEAGIAASHSFISVGERPTFTTYPAPVDITEPQKPILLKCRAKGTPKPEIKWFKDGLLILGTPEESRFHITIEGSLVFMGKRYHVTREGSLIIFDPRVEDEGSYTCKAENELGQVSYSVSLYVEMSAKACRSCRTGGVCAAVQYDCLCSKGFHKEKNACVETKKTKNKETGSGSGREERSGSGSGSGDTEQSGDERPTGPGVESGDGSGEEQPTRPVTHGSKGPGVDQEESGDDRPTRKSVESEVSGDVATTTRGPIDQEESGQETTTRGGNDRGSGSVNDGSGGEAGGETEEGRLSTWEPENKNSRRNKDVKNGGRRQRRSVQDDVRMVIDENETINPLEAPPS